MFAALVLRRALLVFLALSRKQEAATHVEIRQVRADICAHFVVVQHVASVLGVRAHGAGAVASVEVLAGLLGVELQAADGAEEGRGGTHVGGVMSKRKEVFA